MLLNYSSQQHLVFAFYDAVSVFSVFGHFISGSNRLNRFAFYILIKGPSFFPFQISQVSHLVGFSTHGTGLPSLLWAYQLQWSMTSCFEGHRALEMLLQLYYWYWTSVNPALESNNQYWFSLHKWILYSTNVKPCTQHSQELPVGVCVVWFDELLIVQFVVLSVSLLGKFSLSICPSHHCHSRKSWKI